MHVFGKTFFHFLHQAWEQLASGSHHALLRHTYFGRVGRVGLSLSVCVHQTIMTAEATPRVSQSPLPPTSCRQEDVVVARSSVVSSKAWQPRVKVALQRRPQLTMTLLRTAHAGGVCDACKRAEHAAPYVVSFEGGGVPCLLCLCMCAYTKN